MPDANGYPLPWEPGWYPGIGTATGPPPAQQPAPAAAADQPAPAAASDQPAAAPADQPAAQPAPAPAAPPASSQTPQQQYDKEIADVEKELQTGRDLVVSLQKQITDTQAKIDSSTNPIERQQLQTSVDRLWQSLITAHSNVASASERKATVIQKGIETQQLLPSQVEKAQAERDLAKIQADKARSEVDILKEGSEGQRNLTAAQTAAATAEANARNAAAAAQNAKTPAEKAQLEAQATQMRAQADQLHAQIPGLEAKAAADRAQGRLTNAQADLEEIKKQTAGRASEAATTLLELQVKEAQSKVGGLPTLEQQVAINNAAVAQAQANVDATRAGATKTQEEIEKSRMGPVYGLQDQIDAIKKIQAQVFGPGGTGDPEHANDLLQQFFTATVGGTTPANAAVNAATAQGNLYATQMTGVNALQAAQASRANQYASLGGQALGTLASMNQYAPRGSQAGADAYRALMNDMATRLAQPQFAPVQMPQAPELPQFMQAFAMGHRAATATAAAATGNAGATGAGAQGGQPAININVNGQPAGSTTLPPTLGDLGSNDPRYQNTRLEFFGGNGYTNPPSITNPPATGITPQLQMQSTAGAQQQTPQQAFNQGVASTYQIPNFAQQYLPNPMNMLRLNQGLAQGAY